MEMSVVFEKTLLHKQNQEAQIRTHGSQEQPLSRTVDWWLKFMQLSRCWTHAHARSSAGERTTSESQILVYWVLYRDVD